MPRERYAQRRDRVEDVGGLQAANLPPRYGTVIGFRDQGYVAIRWDVLERGPDGVLIEEEQVEFGDFGRDGSRWDEERSMWVFAPDPDALPADHPATIMFHGVIDGWNEQLQAAKRERDSVWLRSTALR